MSERPARGGLVRRSSPPARRHRHRLPALLVVALALLASAAWAPVASAQDPLTDPARYCDPSPPPGSLGALTDAEHDVRVGDPPLRPGMRRRRVTVDGVSTVVTEAGRRGADEAVVFAHGSPNHGREWDRLLSAAGKHGRAIAFDFPGWGHADDRFGGDYTIAGASRFFGRLMSKLGVRRVHLVMHDLGGMWSLEWAMRRNAALKSVVVIDSGVLLNYVGHPTGIAWAVPLTGEASMASTTRQSFTTSVQAQNPKPLPRAFVDRMYDFFDRRTRCAALPYYRAIAARGGPDPIGRRQAAELRKRRRPALVIWGEQDPYIPPSVAYEQRHAFPGARVVIIAGAGHWPFVDYPGRVEALVIPFLRRVLGTGDRPGVAAPPGAAGRACAGRRPTLLGTSGADDLRGTPSRDVIAAGAGDDRISGAGGEDVICAGAGHDRADGGSADDRVEGGSGDDSLRGAGGRDILVGGSGRDRCDAGPGGGRPTGCEE